MAITRKYETERECANLWITEDFNFISDWMITDNPDYWSNWDFMRYLEEEEREDYGYDPEEEAPLYCANPPMWGTYFEPKHWLDHRWMIEHEEEIAALGFTLIYHDGEFWGLGIDGAGFDFYEAYWIPLYRLRGFTWHED